VSCCTVRHYCRQRRNLDHRRNVDEEKLGDLEQNVRETREAALDSERKYDDVSKLDPPRKEFLGGYL